MFSGLKFIPRDQIEKDQYDKREDTRKAAKQSNSRKNKDRRKKKSPNSSSSDDAGLDKIKLSRKKKQSSNYSSSDDAGLDQIKLSRKTKKWYASDEDLFSCLDESEDEEISKKKREKNRPENSSEDDDCIRLKKKSSRRKNYSYEDHSSSYDSDDKQPDTMDENYKEAKIKGHKKTKEKANKDNLDDGGKSQSQDMISITRKERGLEWMFRPKENNENMSATTSHIQLVESPIEEVMKENPKELNPYLKGNGSGYPDDADGSANRNRLLSSSVVGDGGASWRLKALKRAQEQAAREGRKLDEVVEQRWDSLGQLTVSVASGHAANSRAHIHATKSRQKGRTEALPDACDKNERSSEKLKMKVPQFHDSLSWGKPKSKIISTEDSSLISSVMSSLNKFSNDGSFMLEVMSQQNDASCHLGSSSTKCEKRLDSELVSLESENYGEKDSAKKPMLSANQLAAKALQLRMKGKHEEAEKLMRDVENVPGRESAAGNESCATKHGRRYIMHDMSGRKRRNEEDVDMHLAKRIMKNQQYTLSGRADDEYDYDDDPKRKSRKKGGSNDHKSSEITHANRSLAQHERCQFCFENPTRLKNLVVAIANFTYLTLPHWEQVVPGHCCIIPMQHESATRSIDNNVWDEIRNFKKCLIMMFAKQEKELVFLETVVGLAKQKRHCLIECIPLPREIASEAPLYFKKEIDEAEEEWSQHNAKKLIDTSEKGLRGSIPKDFPYFHVEFGLNKGFVHVIDDEKQFRSNFGLNVIRGMMQLPAEDMHRRQKRQSVETQNQAVAKFVQDWEPFDWTKQLD